jgi:GT2 family glycosyltransferase
VDVSVIIVNWNTRDILYDCLKSVYEQTSGLDFEVIVIDNASEDGSQEMVKKEFREAVLIENSTNRGFAAANNQGLEIAKGRYALLLNSDTVVLENAIAKTVTYADTKPEAAVVGCRILYPDKSLQTSCFMFPSLLNLLFSATYLYKLFPESRIFGRENISWWNRDDEREVEVVTGCFMLVRREAIGQVGVMDENFFMYGEETDWCYRFNKSGWKCLFTPVATIVHIHGASSRRRKCAMELQCRASILHFIRKHRGELYYRLACIMFALNAFLRIPYWFFRWLFSGRKNGEAWSCVKMHCSGTYRALLGWQALSIKQS